MADFDTSQSLSSSRPSLTKVGIAIDHGLTKTMLKTACRNSNFLRFYDFVKIAKFACRTSICFFSFSRHFHSPPFLTHFPCSDFNEISHTCSLHNYAGGIPRIFNFKNYFSKNLRFLGTLDLAFFSTSILISPEF